MSLGGCKKNVTRTKTAICFDTVVSISLTAESAQKADVLLDRAFSICENYDRMLDMYSVDSELYALNSSAGTEVRVADELYEILLLCRKYYQLTDGAFNPSMGAVSELWSFQSENPTVPEKSEIAELLQAVGFDGVVSDEGTVTVSREAKIDLGGIAKGYITDKITEMLINGGAVSATVNLGGNVAVLSNGKTVIGISDPFSSSGGLAERLCCDGRLTVSTAGSYQRYFESDGELYHHILDPDTGYPADTGLVSVTVISESSAEADALSTALFVMGAEEGLDLLRALDSAEAVFITEDGKTLLSDGLARADGKICLKKQSTDR